MKYEKENKELQQQISASDKSIVVIKEEYEAKIKAVEEEKEKALKESEERHNSQIRSLLKSGEMPSDKQNLGELNFEEQLIQDLRIKNHIGE